MRPSKKLIKGDLRDMRDGKAPCLRASPMQPNPGHLTVPAYELILDACDLLPFSFLRRGDQVGRAVVKLQCRDGVSGTGTLVASGVLLTNNHVVPDNETAASTHALANYETLPPVDVAGRSAVAVLRPDILFVTHAELDFTFCGVEGLDFLGSAPPSRNSRNVSLFEYVNIIQHPRGRPKEVALQDNRVIKADEVVLHYACDTEVGSSGSPVFNNSWQLVALHHASVPTEELEGRHALVGDAEVRFVNEGIRLSAVAACLEMMVPKSGHEVTSIARASAVFRGVDPGLGFFGALGREVLEESGVECIKHAYQRKCDDIDIGVWDVTGLSRRFREYLPSLGSFMGEMQLDIWCLSGLTPVMIRGLCEHLDTNFRLEYERETYAIGSDRSFALLYRRGVIGVATLKPGLGIVRDNYWWITVRILRRAQEPWDFLLLFVGNLGVGPSPTLGLNMTEEDLGKLGNWFGRILSRQDCLIVGNPPTLRSLCTGESLKEQNYQWLSASCNGEVRVILLLGPASPVRRCFLSSNLVPDGESVKSRTTVVHDRPLPSSILDFIKPGPSLMRLSLRASDSKGRFTVADAGCSLETDNQNVLAVARAGNSLGQATERASDDLLEERLRKLLRPVIAELMAEMRDG